MLTNLHSLAPDRSTDETKSGQSLPIGEFACVILYITGDGKPAYLTDSAIRQFGYWIL